MNPVNCQAHAPLFTVVLPVYKNDCPVQFERALRSIHSNDLRFGELLIVQDGPVPQKTSCVIAKYTEIMPLRHISIPINVGLARALNTALETIDTEFIIRADADDINLPHRFSQLIRELQNGFDIVGSAILDVDSTGKPIGRRSPPTKHHEIVRYAALRSPFNHMSVGFRTSFVKRIGGYPVIHLKEDYALWCKSIKCGAHLANISDVLVHAQSGDDLFRRRGGAKYIRSELTLQVYLWRIGFHPLWRALIAGASRSLIFALPVAIKALVYKLILRER